MSTASVITHVPSIASRVARTASTALSNLFAPVMLSISESGGVTSIIKSNPGLRHGVYVYKGTLTNEIIGEAFHIPYKSIELLISVNPY